MSVTDNVGLVIEGGGMRGLFNSGVMEAFLEQKLSFPYVIGVSAGACSAASYISCQRGRNRKVQIDCTLDPRYLSYKSWLTGKGLFTADFVFEEIPRKIVPFDFDTFFHSPQRFLIGVTDCESGQPVYFDKNECEDVLKVIRASSSLPFLAPVVHMNGRGYLDGGLSDPIPIHKALQDGCRRVVVLLTRNHGYRKSPSQFAWLAKLIYRRYPRLADVLQQRHQLYNRTLDDIAELERQGRAFVFRPLQPLRVGRLDIDQEKLLELYGHGYEQANSCYEQLRKWLEQ